MATVMDVPEELGSYMLRGWILTDTVCSQCHQIPLLRSPSASRNPVPPFCVSCDPDPSLFSNPQSLHAKPKPASPSTVSTSDSISRGSHSTAPTEVSSHYGSPELIPVDTPESIRRRQQSDAAASEIGRRLLKGWAMLADECPGAECYGVPLVRPPETGEEKDPRKECVVCGTVYVDQNDITGTVSLAPLEDVGHRELAITAEDSHHPGPLSSAQSHANFSRSGAFGQQLTCTTQSVAVPATAQYQGGNVASVHYSTSPADQTASVLEKALRSLSDKLRVISDLDNIDVALVGQTADVISKVTHALLAVKQLRQGEYQQRYP